MPARAAVAAGVRSRRSRPRTAGGLARDDRLHAGARATAAIARLVVGDGLARRAPVLGCEVLIASVTCAAGDRLPTYRRSSSSSSSRSAARLAARRRVPTRPLEQLRRVGQVHRAARRWRAASKHDTVAGHPDVERLGGAAIGIVIDGRRGSARARRGGRAPRCRARSRPVPVRSASSRCSPPAATAASAASPSGAERRRAPPPGRPPPPPGLRTPRRPTTAPPSGCTGRPIAGEHDSRGPGGLGAAHDRAGVARVTRRRPRRGRARHASSVVERRSGHRRHGEHRLRASRCRRAARARRP